MKVLSRRMLALVLVLMLIFMASACTPTSSGTTTQPDNTGSEQVSENTDEETETPAEVGDLEPYELTYYMLVNTISPDESKIEEKVNSIIQPKINATLDLVLLDWGTYHEKFTTAMNAGEKIDISFTADWWYYLDYVANNFLFPLNDTDNNLLEKYAPQVVKDLGEGFVVGSQIDGMNYGVPTDKEFAVNAGFVFRKDLAEKYGFDMTQVKKVADLEPMLKVIKENEPNIIPYLIDNGGTRYTYPFTEFVGGLGIEYDVLDDTEIKFEWEAERNLEMVKTHKKFYDAGYIHKEAYTENHRYNDHLLEGDFFVTQQPLKPNKGKSTELMAAAGNKFELDEVEVTPYVGTSLHAAGSMLAIPRTSGDPDRAMMFINLMHTDADLANALVWGIEGTHHTVVKEAEGDNPKVVKPVEGNTWTSAALPWTIGNVFIHWLNENESVEKHEGFRLTKEQAPSHITLGYRFKDRAKYQAELAAIDNALKESKAVIATGAVKDFDAAYAKMIKDCEAAGLRTVQKALQDDLNAWLEKQGKK